MSKESPWNEKALVLTIPLGEERLFHMFKHACFYTPEETAAVFKVAVASVYQSMPGAKCRPKLGRKLPEPLRLGRLIRWTGQQLNDWAGIPQSKQTTQPTQAEVPAAASGRGRPRKVAVAGVAA